MMNEILLFIIVLILIVLVGAMIFKDKIVDIVAISTGLVVITSVAYKYREQIKSMYRNMMLKKPSPRPLTDAEKDEVAAEVETESAESVHKALQQESILPPRETKLYAEDVHNERTEKRQNRFDKYHLERSKIGNAQKMYRIFTDIEKPSFDWIDNDYESILY
jgi:hypothetical protein